jgi:hypothetical protein
MDDWLGLVGSVLWIVGLAIDLAALSMAHYQARLAGERLWAALSRAGVQLALAAGTVLFSIGLMLCSDPWWQKVPWGLCAALLVVWVLRLWRRLSATGKEGE